MPKSTSLSPEEIERYQRHIVLKEIGGAGQQKLAATRVLIVGLGGLGTPLAQYLAAAGVGHLGLLDDDVVSVSNLHRQVLYTKADIGRPKAEIAAQWLAQLNPHIEARPIVTRLKADNVEALIGDYDVIADGCDNFATRFLVNDACFKQRKILVSGAVGRFDGQVTTFKPWLSDDTGTPFPCYRSLVPQIPDDEKSCATTGIIGALTGVIGSLQALEVIKEITSAGESLAGRLLIYDGLGARTRTVKLNWDPSNPNNGRNTGFRADG